MYSVYSSKNPLNLRRITDINREDLDDYMKLLSERTPKILRSSPGISGTGLNKAEVGLISSLELITDFRLSNLKYMNHLFDPKLTDTGEFAPKWTRVFSTRR